MKTFTIHKYGKKHPLSIEIGHYGNGNMAIRTYTHENGYKEPWGNLTVNLDIRTKKFVSYIDTSNNGEEIIDVLVKNNFGEPTGFVIDTTYCSFPEFKFNPETLALYDPENFEEYDAYDDAYRIVEEYNNEKNV